MLPYVVDTAALTAVRKKPGSNFWGNCCDWLGRLRAGETVGLVGKLDLERVCRIVPWAFVGYSTCTVP